LLFYTTELYPQNCRQPGHCCSVSSRFSLLIDVGHLALNWQSTSVCEYCLAKCKQILTTQEISEKTTAKFAFDLLTLRLGLLRDTCCLEHSRDSLLEVHKQYLVSGHQLLKNGLENGLDGPNVYTGCVILWEICMPLFQRPTRQEKQLRDSLNLILKALDQTGRIGLALLYYLLDRYRHTASDWNFLGVSIETSIAFSFFSLHYQLLCQIHWMQAQCLADVDQIPQALTHLEQLDVISVIQALRYEDTGELRDAILHLRNRLTLRSSLYEIPSRVEDIAGQILEHLASINPKDLSPNNIKQLFRQTSWSGNTNEDKKMAETFSLDVVFKRIGETLAPSTFAKAWEVCKRLEGFEKQTPHPQLTNRRLERSAREQDTLERLLWLSNNAQIWSDLSLIFQQELTNLFTEQSEDLKNAQQRQDILQNLSCSSSTVLDSLSSIYEFDFYYVTNMMLLSFSTVSSKTLLSTRKSAPRKDDGTNTLGSTAKAASHSGSPRGKLTLGKHPLNISPGTRNLQELNVLRALAEVNCLYAESLCVLLRGQHRQCHLGGKMHKLHAPWDHLDTRIDGEPGLGAAESTSFRMEKRLIENEKKLEYWKVYCDWLQVISESAMLVFQRSARISTELRDTQLFQACVVCLWNHCLPAVCAGEHDQLVATFQVSVVTKIPTSSKWHLCACTFIANNLEDLSKQTGDLNFDSGHGIPDKMPLLFTFVHEQHMWWRHCQIIPNTVFQIILDCGDSLGSKALPLDLHCELASVYAHGSIQPWMPKSDLGVLLLHKNRDASPTMKTKTPTSKGQKNVALHGRSPERPKVFMATALMERAFPKDMISHGDIDQPTYAHKPSVPQIRRVTDSDRVVELSLWMKLIRCAIFEQDYNLALQISDSAHMEHELSPTKSSRRDYYMAAFLNLRGLAVFGLFGLLKMQRSNSQHNKRSQSPSKHVTIGHVKPLVPNNEISDLFGDSIESSMFIAAEEALFNAAKFASRAKRYDLLVSCAEAYWKLCKNSELTFFASVVQMLHQCVPLKERCKQILELLVKSIAPDQRAKLNEAIRSESATPAEGDQPEVSDHFDQDLEVVHGYKVYFFDFLSTHRENTTMDYRYSPMASGTSLGQITE
ncbi:hypothetical protein T265_12421, partial [Opisthorchis viverrini]